MIIGFNTDIKFRGRTYHAQTEDHGNANPLIETLVYIGGDILDSIRTKYADLMAEGYEEAKVVQLMENQHRKTIELIRSGHYLSEEDKKALEVENEQRLVVIGGIADNERPFSDLVWDWLVNEMVEEEVELIMHTDGEIVSGSKVSLTLKASKSITRGLVAGADLTIRFISTIAAPIVVYEGKTDRMGECHAEFELPSLGDGNGAIIVKCECDLGSSELRQLVQRAA